MPTDTTVKFIHSGMANSPALSGTAGALLGVLDACLVTGFGLVSLTSLVIAGGVATGTVSAGHSFEAGTVALIAGATTSGGSVNGEQKIVSTTTNTFTFATTLADQAATGSPTAKVAPLGWSNSDVAAGTNIKAYRPTDVASTRFYLRVDDTAAQEARWVGYETMSDINTGTGPFPTSAQQSGGLYVAKSITADAVAREWTLVGDGKRFYFIPRAGSASNAARPTMMFGDFISRKSPDAYKCHIVAPNSSYFGSSGTVFAQPGDVSYCGPSAGTGASTGSYSARGVSGLGSSTAARRYAHSIYGSDNYSGGTGSTSLAAYPNQAANELLLSEIELWEMTSPRCLRGKLSGVYYCPQEIGPTEFAHRATVTGATGLTGKVLRALVGSSNSNAGPLFVDTTGPWS